MKTADGLAVLIGDWRRRKGSKTDAHLWASSKRPDWQRSSSDQRPKCGRVIPRFRTVAVSTGRPCTECLVAAITQRS